MSRYSFGYPRRRSTSRTRQHIGCIVLAVAGIGLGIGGSMVWPWGWAHPPGSLEAPQEPAPGMLLMSADMIDAATVPAASVRHFGPPAQATGTAVFIRGAQHGHRRVYVECHPDGMLLIEGDKPATWKPNGNGIADLVAQALCHEHPLLRQHQLEQTT
jgi:hypothetical protein